MLSAKCLYTWLGEKKNHHRKQLLGYLADLADYLAAGIKSGDSAYGQWFLNSKRCPIWFWVWFTNHWASLSSYRLDKLTHDPVDEQAVFEVTLSTEQVAKCWLWVAMLGRRNFGWLKIVICCLWLNVHFIVGTYNFFPFTFSVLISYS